MKPAALVTGACGGIGRALCEVFTEAGYLVVGIDRYAPEAYPHTIIHCDIRHLAQSDQTAEALKKDVLNITAGRLDVLINNAAVQIIKPCNELTRSDWAATLETNLLAPFWLTTLFLPELRGSKGSVINIGSIHARLTKRQFVAYATSKGALETMTKAMALDLAPEVRVNAIAPAATDTPMLRAGFQNNPDGIAALEHYHPLERIASPKEISKVALFLASSKSEFITGSTIDVDGGIGGCLSDPEPKPQKG
jgi:NAD(P)-dependent dehydrogenase (short-subunit alcohol dehydrogenase family)